MVGHESTAAEAIRRCNAEAAKAGHRGEVFEYVDVRETAGGYKLIMAFEKPVQLLLPPPKQSA